MSVPPWDYIAKLVCIGDSGTGKSSLTIRLCEGRFTTTHDVTIGVEFDSRVVPVGPPASDELGIQFDSGAQGLVTDPASGYMGASSDNNNNNNNNSKAGKRNLGDPPLQKRMKLSLWDTAGQETYKSITRSYFRGASGALLVFDITRRATFTSLAQWLQDLRQIADDGIEVILVGNKNDLVEEDEEPHASSSLAVDGHGGKSNNSNNNDRETSDRDIRKDKNNAQSVKRRQVTREEAEDWCRANNIVRYVETSAKSGEGVERAFREVAERIYRNIQRGKYDLEDRRSGVKGYGAASGGTGKRRVPRTVTLGVNDAMKSGNSGWSGGCC